MKGADVSLLILGAVIMAGLSVLLSYKLVSPVTGTVDSVGRLAMIEILNAPGGAIKIATYLDEDGQRVRDDAVDLMNLSGSTPYAMAVHPTTSTLEMSDFIKISNVLQDEGISLTFSELLFLNCQQWLTFTDPLMKTFNAEDTKIVGRYYAGLSATAIRPDALSSHLDENWGEAQKLCGASCINAEVCASCAEMADEFRLAFEQTRFTEAQDIESSMRLKGCGESCAQVCESVYSGLKALFGFDIEAKKAFISSGLMIK